MSVGQCRAAGTETAILQEGGSDVRRITALLLPLRGWLCAPARRPCCRRPPQHARPSGWGRRPRARSSPTCPCARPARAHRWSRQPGGCLLLHVATERGMGGCCQAGRAARGVAAFEKHAIKMSGRWRHAKSIPRAMARATGLPDDGPGDAGTGALSFEPDPSNAVAPPAEHARRQGRGRL